MNEQNGSGKPPSEKNTIKNVVKDGRIKATMNKGPNFLITP